MQQADACAGTSVFDLAIVLLTGSFIDTILYSAPVVWIFFLATGLSLFRLRAVDASRPRSSRVPFYPAIPLVFCGTAAFMAWSAVSYALSHKPAGLLVLGAMLLAGFGVYAWERKQEI